VSEPTPTVQARIPASLRAAVDERLRAGLQTPRELGLPAERVRLTGEDPVGALRTLTATIKEQTKT
jgi:hypothetical protein